MRHLFTSFNAFLFFTFSAYCQCPVNDFAIVSSSIVCANSTSAIVTASPTIDGRTYQAFEGSNPVGGPAVSIGGNITIQIPIGTNFGQGYHIIYFKSKAAGCPDISTTDTTTVIVNKLPRIDLLVIGDTVCGNPSGSSVIIKNSEVGVIYIAYIGSIAVSGPVMGTGSDIYINLTNLKTGNNTIYFTASRKGCPAVNLTNTANLTVMPYVDIFYSVTGDVICQGKDAKVKVKYSGQGLLFEAFLGNQKIGIGKLSTGEDIEFVIPSEKLVTGINIVRIHPVPDLPKGCPVYIDQNAEVRVNPVPQYTLQIIGDTVSINDEYAEITIKRTNSGMTYQLMENNTLIGNVTATNNEPVKYKIPVGDGPGKLSAGTHKIVVSFMSIGCESKTYTDTATILVTPSVLLGYNDEVIAAELKVWPNPFTSEIHLELSKPSGGLMIVNLRNSLGDKIYDKEFNPSESIKLDPNMPNGIYYLELITSSYKKRIKVVK